MMSNQTSEGTKQPLPWLQYGLGWNPRKNVSTTQYVLYAVQIAVIIILSYLSVVMLGPLSYSGISLFYFVTPFFMVFSMWWGLWGMIGGYLGAVIGAGLMVGLGVVPSLLYATGDLVYPLLAFIVYREFLAKRGIDPLWRDLVYKEIHGTPAKRGAAWGWFILLNAIIFNIPSAELGVGIQYALGLIPPSAFWFWWWGWILSDAIPLIIMAPIIIRGLSDLVERQGLVNLGWIT